MIDLDNFIIVKKYKKKYACTCDLCGESRGFRYKEDTTNPCYNCAIKKRNNNFKPDPSSDFVVTKDRDKKFRAYCKECGKDRGYIDKRFFHKKCPSCSKKEFYLSKPKDEQKLVQRKLRHNVKSNINGRLRCRGGSKSGNSTFKILPYSLIELRKHIESKFQEGMNWENYGKWEIDHIIPDSWFTYGSIDDDEFKKSWALDNLQPMWKRENASKSNKYSGPFDPLYNINRKIMESL